MSFNRVKRLNTSILSDSISRSITNPINSSTLNVPPSPNLTYEYLELSTTFCFMSSSNFNAYTVSSSSIAKSSSEKSESYCSPSSLSSLSICSFIKEIFCGELSCGALLVFCKENSDYCGGGYSIESCSRMNYSNISYSFWETK